ncbi:uncharacterized protein LOC143473090 isoform X2 [Clavelina lepadiformis]|uniref:uncharacterized protein LOC143473090 isoform X2 n=1 Tax=Clavelina lepadiformis TaxID=159417 RepID=UPI00404113FC
MSSKKKTSPVRMIRQSVRDKVGRYSKRRQSKTSSPSTVTVDTAFLFEKPNSTSSQSSTESSLTPKHAPLCSPPPTQAQRPKSMYAMMRSGSVDLLGGVFRNGQSKGSETISSISSPITTQTNGSLTLDSPLDQKPLPPLRQASLTSPINQRAGKCGGRQRELKSGYLRKQGGMIKTWNERWFVLKGDQLHYYKEKEGKLIASIFLPGNHVVMHPVRTNDSNKYVFEIFPGKESARMSNNHESYLIAANSQTDMEDWVKAIRRVILSPFGGGIFGQRLDETMRYDRRLDSSATGTTSTGASSRSSRRQAPIIVENCVDFIRSHGGLDEEGIFRLPGHANEVKDLQDAYDMGERPMFPKATDVHTVASLLKGYLRELPEPVIPFERYDALLEAAKISQRDDNCKTTEVDSCSKSREEAKKMIKEQLNLLPQPNFDLLRYLCRFLHQVQQHSEANKMHISNLAMVFGPTVMRPKHDNPHSMISEASRVQHVMFLFISYQKCFFPDDDDQAGMRSLPDITVDALGRSPDAGIGTLTSTTSPPGTLGQRHTTDDSGTGSLGPTPENTNKRAPPVPNAPPPLRAKPNKPMRRKVSESLMTTSAEEQRKSLYDNVTVSSNSASDTASAVPGSRCSSDWRRSNGSAPSESSVTTATTGQGSYYVNNRSTPALSQNGSPRSSTNAVAGSIGTPDSCHSSPADDVSNPRQRALPRAVRRPRGVRPPTSGTYQTDEESNTESVAPDDRTFSTLSSHRSSVHQELDPLEKSRSSSYPNSSRPVTALPRRDVANVSLAINRLSMESGSDASSVSSAPTIPSRPHRRLKKEGASLSSGSRQNSNAEVLSNAGDSSSPPIVTRSSNLVSSTSTSVSGRVTAKEMEDEIRMLKEELQKQRLEHEKRSRMLEEHYIMKMRSSASALAPFTAASASPNPPAPSLASHPIPSCSSIGGAEDLVGSPFQPNSLYPVASYTDESVLMDAAFDGTSIVPQSPHLPLSRRQSSESHAEMKYREEAKRHAMTKIRLRNAERGLKQAEERNRQLQKEMEDFFETFGNLLPEGVM